MKIQEFSDADPEFASQRQISTIGKLTIMAVFPVLGAVFCSALFFAYSASGTYALVATTVTLLLSPWFTQMAYTSSLRALTRAFPTQTLLMLVLIWTATLLATVIVHYKFVG